VRTGARRLTIVAKAGRRPGPLRGSVVESAQGATAIPAHIHPAIESHEANLASRRHTRMLFTVPITLRHLCRGGVRASHGISLDLGEGGMGAIVQEEVRVGDTVAIDLPLREQLLSTVAIVRHSSNVRSGFEFVGLTPEERLQITSVIEES
jgi:hypothetical protein